MDDTLQDNEIEYTNKNAKDELEKGNYNTAKTIFETLWNNSSKNDPYLLFNYGQALRKTKNGLVFIEICKELNGNKDIMSNKFVVSTLCWCLYDCYIKNYSVDDKEGFDYFIKRAEYIINNCEQMDANEYYKNPFVLTVIKVVKIYRDKPSKNYNEILKWLSYLNQDKLSEDVFCFKDETGKDRELASPKEFYYQNMAKTLEKMGKFKECIEVCEKAINQISKFHYRNEMWIKTRMYYSKCMLNDKDNIDDAIKGYREIAYKENFWFMYHKLSQICFSYNRLSEALLYASKAFTCRFEYEKMVNLMFDTALLWQASGIDVNAKIFFQASAYYRKRQGWQISEELQYYINLYEIDINKKPEINTMRNISNDYIMSIEGKIERVEGKVINIVSPHGRSGFIKPSKGGQNVYFKMKDVYGEKVLKKGNKVEYELFKENNGKTRAIKIMLRS